MSEGGRARERVSEGEREGGGERGTEQRYEACSL